GVVARIGEAGLGVDVEPGQRYEAGQFGAADARLGDVVRRVGAVQRDQLVDAGLVGVEGPVPAVGVLREADVDALGLFRLQRRIARPRVIQVVEGRRLETAAGAGGQAQA